MYNLVQCIKGIDDSIHEGAYYFYKFALVSGEDRFLIGTHDNTVYFDCNKEFFNSHFVKIFKRKPCIHNENCMHYRENEVENLITQETEYISRAKSTQDS